MAIIHFSMISSAELSREAKIPLIICTGSARLKRQLMESGFEDFSVNVPLAEALLKYPEESRSHRVSEVFLNILPNRGKLHLMNFEMLFDPRYAVDALKLFTEAAKHRQIAVEWPGKLDGTMLTYADPKYEDYHRFNTEDYTLTCVIQEEP